MATRPLTSAATVAIVLLFSVARPVQATIIDLILFEQLVLTADVVAIVECDTAGGIVARYKVIESFKGPEVGSLVLIKEPSDFWSPRHFPPTLCGKRFLVTAFKAPPSNLISTTSGGPVPLWWRQFPIDFRTPLYQGWTALPHDFQKDKECQALLRYTKVFLAMKSAEQEFVLLRAAVDRYFLRLRDAFPVLDVAENKPKDAATAALAKKFDGFKTVGEILDELISQDGRNKKEEEQESCTYRVMLHGGMAATKAYLEKVPADKLPFGKDRLVDVREEIEARLKSPDAKRLAPRDDTGISRNPTDAQLQEWRQALLGQRDSAKWGVAFVNLTHHSPEVVVEYLRQWTEASDGKRRGDPDPGYGLGSYFGWRCVKDRAKNLAALADAKDPWIRVAAAVYLCFDAKDAAVAALKRLTAVEGPPGAWAALTLVRRGDKEAVTRALDLIPTKKQLENTDTILKDRKDRTRQTLADHLLTVLSNAAQAGNAPQIEFPVERALAFEDVDRWWQQIRDRAVLGDPWMGILEKQKID
jgi:hypothetical protein